MTPTTSWCAPPSASDGYVEMEIVCEPVFDYGRLAGRRGRSSTTTGMSADATGARRDGAAADRPARRLEGERVRGRHVLREGERLVLRAVVGRRPRGAGRRATTPISGSRRPWSSGGDWLARRPHPRSPVPGPDPALGTDRQGPQLHADGRDRRRAHDRRCPRRPGGERNWDYRYSWLRDSTFTLQALHWLNLDWEADEFMQFVADLEPNEDGGCRSCTASTVAAT